jgi:hypothetical protein
VPPGPGTYPATPAATGANVCPGGAQAGLLLSPYNPSNQPALGSTTAVVTIPTGIDSGTYNAANTTYYFLAGFHNLPTGTFASIQMGNNSWYVGEYSGGQGATLDGNGVNQAGLLKDDTTVPAYVEYLTVQNFAPLGAGAAIGINYSPSPYTDGATPATVAMYNTVEDNYPGSGIILGTNGVAAYNCLTHNGTYGVYDYCLDHPGDAFCDNSPLTNGPQDVTVDHNEISFNDQCNWEAIPDAYFPVTRATSTSYGCPTPGPTTEHPGCGCAGGMKFWATDGTRATDNYVHDNYEPGLWWDTLNNAEYINGNYFSNNFKMGIDIEISYNALITNNNFVQNAWGSGGCGPEPANSCFSAGNLAPAIYDSESGGTGGNIGNAAWPTGTPINTFTIQGNNFNNNWDAILSYDTPERFASNGLPANNYGTLGLPITDFTGYWDQSSADIPTTPFYVNNTGSGGGCSQPNLTTAHPGASPDYWQNCWWKVSNLNVTGNTFEFNSAGMCGVGTTGSTICCTPTSASYCGMNAVWQQAGGGTPWSPYFTLFGGYGMWGEMDNCRAPYSFAGCVSLNNFYSGNTYTHTGSQNWRFLFYNGGPSNVLTPGQWQTNGWDGGSTFT